MGWYTTAYITLVAVSSGAVVQLPLGSVLQGIHGTSSDSRLSDTDRLVDQYLGIPFAEPPIGNLRFRPPRKLEPLWEGVRHFSKSAKPCFSGRDSSLEDCLYLNVFRPSTLNPSERLPVMVWIHGGGFTHGRVDVFNGTELAARNRVIVVVPAYRLGMLGFYASRATFNESGTTGNWGILDQRMALSWVHENIQAFGGDTQRVVLFGQSAGAFSIAAHLVSPGSAGLFSAAILSSPTTHSSYFFQDMENSVAFSDWAAKTLGGCQSGDDLECLRSVDVSKLAVKSAHRDINSPPQASRLFPFMPWGLTIDGVVLSGTPLDMARLGKVSNVPVILGLTEDEGTAFALLLSNMVRPAIRGDIPVEVIRNITNHLIGNPDLTETLLSGYFRFQTSQYVEPAPLIKLPDDETNSDDLAANLLLEFEAIRSRDISEMTAEEFASAVPSLRLVKSVIDKVTFDKTPMEFFADALKNSLFACPTMDFAQAMASYNGGRVWLYNFALDVWTDTPWVGTRLVDAGGGSGNLTFDDLGAFHGAEIPFIWNLFPQKPLLPSELGNPLSLFSAYSNNRFCPSDSFKRRVADQVGCLWTNLAKCDHPQCNDRQCEIPVQWNTYGKSDDYLNLHGRGEYSRGKVVSASLPDKDQCAIWKDLRVPAFDFIGDARRAVKPIRSNYYADASSSSHMSASFLLLFINIIIAVVL